MQTKTIEHPDGTADVVVDTRVFAPGRGGASVRTIEHEGLHVALGQRGESLQDVRRRSEGAGSARGVYVEIAGIASDEARLLGVDWVSFVETMLKLPTADVPCARAMLDALANTAAEHARGHIGVIWTDEPDGQLGFCTLPGHSW